MTTTLKQRETVMTGMFQEACDFAGVQATRRQVSKFRNGYGALAAAVRKAGCTTLHRYIEVKKAEKTRPTEIAQ